MQINKTGNPPGQLQKMFVKRSVNNPGNNRIRTEGVYICTGNKKLDLKWENIQF